MAEKNKKKPSPVKTQDIASKSTEQPTAQPAEQPPDDRPSKSDDKPKTPAPPRRPYNGIHGRTIIIPSKGVKIKNPERLTYDEAKALCKKHWQLYRYFDF